MGTLETCLSHMIKIDDISVPELKLYSQCSENQLKHIYEPDLGVFIAESPNVIMRAMEAGYIPESMLVEDEHIMGEAKEVLEKALHMVDDNENFRIYSADYERLKHITGYYMVRGMLAVMRRKQLITVEQLCRNAARIVVLEDVVNPTNVGAIIRSAAALGMDGVILTKACADPLYRRAARVSMGTVFQIPWTYFASENEEGDHFGHYVRQLQNEGFQVAAMALDDKSISIRSDELKQVDKLAVVLGTEGDGLKRKTIEYSDFTVKIPMYHGVDSLNVAAASAVAFWELTRG